MYEDVEERRSRLVPILAIVAVLLAIAIAVVVVLYATGMFDRNGAQSADVNQEAAEPIDLTSQVPDTPPAQTDEDARAASDIADRSRNAEAGGPSDVPEAIVSISPAELGQPPIRSTHGDWQVRCSTPAGAQNEQCVLMQFVTAEDRENVGLTVLILKTADGQARIMRIVAPLGVLLPSGLGLNIDETDIGRAGFVRCLPNGCVAEVILDDPVLEQLSAGETATFIIFQTPEEGIGIPISLNGFSAGFEALP